MRSLDSTEWKRTARYLRVDMPGNYITALKKSKTKLQSTLDNSNLQGKSKKVRVIGSSKKIAGSKETVFTAQ